MSIPQLQDYNLPTKMELPANKVDWYLDSRRAALLIHDMQEYFLNFWPKNNHMINQVINHIIKLREFCYASNIPVFYTAQPINQSKKDRALLNDMWGAGLNLKPEEGNIVACLTPRQNDIILTKWRYSAFHRTELEVSLQNLERDQIIICGVYAHIGCLTTATDAFMRDIKPFMVSDALADFTLEDHMMALKYTVGKSGKVLDTSMVLSELANKIESEKCLNSYLVNLLIPLLDDNTDIINENDDLIDHGLDSVRIMSLTTQLRNDGYNVDFISLMNQPTLTNWLSLLENKLILK